MQLKHGTTAAEHLFPGAHSGVKFALGENVKFRQGRFPNTRLGVEATLNRAFLEALDYRRVWLEYEKAKSRAESGETRARQDKTDGAASPALDSRLSTLDSLLPPRRDLRLEALTDIINHQKFIHSHCYRADEILMLLRVAESHGIRVWSLQHVLEGYKVAPEIVKHGASCSTFADWWAYKVEAFDAIPHNAALLHEAGANSVIKSDDWELIRHLYLEAAKTVRYGNMPPDAALQAITLNPAKELGLADRLGSIEVGKQADLAIFSGHPLNAFSHCEQTLIAGEVYFTRDKQPSAMSDAGAARSAKPVELKLLKSEERVKKIDLTAAKSSKYAIVGATIHPIDAEDIPGGVVIIDGGKITAIGPATFSISETSAVLDATGLHVYPGLIDAGTAVGLIEIGKVRETSDIGEIGLFQPDLRAGIAINPDSELIPVARAGGITTVLALPSGGGNMTSPGRSGGSGVITGQASVVQLAGWTMPEMVQNLEAGLHINWPGGKERKQPVEELKRWLK
ncbi:MAG: amidohydrolase family protein, partial [Candidatus Saccharimonas sp.]|nr:amidohydrolase family protein [Planctomycetaceae bacterium]